MSKLGTKARFFLHRVEDELYRVPRVPRRCQRGHRHQGLAIQLFLHPPCSLLMLLNTIYNCVSNGRGCFYRLEVGCLAFTEKLTNPTTN